MKWRDFVDISASTSSGAGVQSVAFDPVSNFILDKDLFHDSTNKSLLIASTNDEYCTETAKKAFANILKTNYLELPADSGHINIDSGFGRWDDILKIALDN